MWMEENATNENFFINTQVSEISNGDIFLHFCKNFVFQVEIDCVKVALHFVWVKTYLRDSENGKRLSKKKQ